MVEGIGSGDEKAKSQTRNGVQRNVRLPPGEASPAFLPPVGGKDPGGQGYVHHIALVPMGTPPPAGTVPCHRSCIKIATGYTQAALYRVILRMYRVTEIRSSRKCSGK